MYDISHPIHLLVVKRNWMCTFNTKRKHMDRKMSDHNKVNAFHWHRGRLKLPHSFIYDDSSQFVSVQGFDSLEQYQLSLLFLSKGSQHLKKIRIVYKSISIILTWQSLGRKILVSFCIMKSVFLSRKIGLRTWSLKT